MDDGQEIAYRRKNFGVKVEPARFPKLSGELQVALTWTAWASSESFQLDPVEARSVIEALESFAAPRS